MSQALSDYFVREAGEYLAELERLLEEHETPGIERIFRLARGVRGSAQVAQADRIADVAARLEGAARFVLEGRIPWNAEIRERAVLTVADLRALVPAAARGWTAAEDARMQAALTRWGGFDDVARTPTPEPKDEPLIRFVRSALEGVIGAIAEATRLLRAAPLEREPLADVLRRIRALRGIARSDLLAPVLEMLDGVEELIRSIAADDLPVDGARLEALVAAEDALRAWTDSQITGDAFAGTNPALTRFRMLRDRMTAEPGPAGDGPVVPIASLFFDDTGPHVVSSPHAPIPATGASAASAEVLAFLRMEATALLDRADALVADGEMQPGADFATPASHLSDLAGAVHELAATYGAISIAEAAADAARALHAATTTDEAHRSLVQLRAALGAGVGGASSIPASGGSAATSPLVPDPATDADVVPIETLLLRGDRALEEALALRKEIDRLLGERGDERSALQTKFTELFDLLELSRSAGSAG